MALIFQRMHIINIDCICLLDYIYRFFSYCVSYCLSAIREWNVGRVWIDCVGHLRFIIWRGNERFPGYPLTCSYHVQLETCFCNPSTYGWELIIVFVFVSFITTCFFVVYCSHLFLFIGFYFGVFFVVSSSYFCERALSLHKRLLVLVYGKHLYLP